MDWNNVNVGSSSKFDKLPAINETKEYTIASCEKITKETYPKEKFWVQTREKVLLPDGTFAEKIVDEGWKIRMVTAEGKVLDTNSKPLIYLLKQNNVSKGSKIKIGHIEKGKWTVELIDNGVSEEVSF